MEENIMHNKVYSLAIVGVVLAAALVLVNFGAPVAKADQPPQGSQPYTTSVSCNTWNDEICYVNISPIPARKRFVVNYITVLAFTDQASDQKVAVSMTFVTGTAAKPVYFRLNPVMKFQLTTGNANWYQASEMVLAFAENVSPTTNGQLYVTRYPVPVSGYNTNVSLWATGYLVND